MSIPRLVSARLHPKKPIDLIANGIQPSGWTYPILTDESRGFIPGFDLLPSISDLKHVSVITMTGSESARGCRSQGHSRRGESQSLSIFLNYRLCKGVKHMTRRTRNTDDSKTLACPHNSGEAGGRTKGARNPMSGTLKEAIIAAAEGHGSDGKGKGGLRGYMKYLYLKDPETFDMLLRALCG
jgi:hypothetical protein